MKNTKVSKEIRHNFTSTLSKAKIDPKLELYLLKKFLLEEGRNGFIPISEYSFNNNSLEQIYKTLGRFDLFRFLKFSVISNEIVVQKKTKNSYEESFNWESIKRLDQRPEKISKWHSFIIDSIDEKRIKDFINKQIKEFKTNKPVKNNKLNFLNLFKGKYYEFPSHFRDSGNNIYSYEKQRETLLKYIARLNQLTGNDILSLRFNVIYDPYFDLLRTAIALEKEKIIDIIILTNYKEKFQDKDDAQLKIKILNFSKIKKYFERKKSKKKVSLKKQKIKFDDKKATLFIGKSEVNFPPFKNEHCLLRTVFKYKNNEPVDWSIIYEEMTKTEPSDSNKNRRTIYDTLRRINNRVKKEINTKDELLICQDKTIKRIF